MSKKITQPIVLNSSSPINDGGRSLNKFYYVAAGVGFVLSVSTGNGLIGGISTAILGALIWLMIKNALMGDKLEELRDYEFKLSNKVPYDLLIQGLQPTLLPIGMRIEKSASGQPLITYDKRVYTVRYNENETFSIQWKSNLKTYMTKRNIKVYQKTVVAMGLIGYNVQKICSAK